MNVVNYKIFSDGACDISNDIIDEKYIIPFNVSLDGELYKKEKAELNINDFYHNIEGIYPKTSVPSVQDYLDKFIPELEEGNHIICITIASALSSSIQSAQIAAQSLKDEYKDLEIAIFDSSQATVSQGLILIELLKMQEAGNTFDEIKTYLDEVVTRSKIHFVIGDVSYLQKGGRMGKVVLNTGKTFNIKPLAAFENGKIVSQGMVRGNKNLVSKLLKNVEKTLNEFQLSEDEIVFAVGYSCENSKELAYTLLREIEEKYPNSKIVEMFRLGATIVSHTGPGTFGVGLIKQGNHKCNLC